MMEKTNSDSPYLLKARKYCDFQERCHSEMRKKLKEWKASRKEVEELISQLITEGYLNEERFARSFVRGKFRIKKWGRRKIVAALRMKGVTDYCIRAGLKEISENDYRDALKNILLKKMKNQTAIETQKAAKYAFSKGFEPELVWEILNKKNLE